MSEKILVVDDSLTIQKVVNITLANTDYILSSAHDETELFDILKKETFSLILLDFNLSENKSGYDLAKEIKKIAPNSSILAMVGTFDSIDDQSLIDSGVNDSIVKPFESTKFVAKCHELIGKDGVDHNPLANKPLLETEDDEEWEINSATDTSINISVDQLASEPVQAKSSLREEIEGWGITMPDIIEAAEIAKEMDSNVVMPPQIDKSEEEHIILEDSKAPCEDDLLFPEVNDEDDSSNPALDSKLISLDDLSLSDDYLDDQSEKVGEESIVRAFSKEEEDFWAVDEEVVIENDLNDQGSSIDFETISEENIEVGPKLERSPDISQELIGQIAEELKPYIEELIAKKVRELSSEIVEKVAWEAIPDLAENLIRSEVKDISKKIQEKHSLS